MVLPLAALSAGFARADDPKPVEFARDIRPIFANSCTGCHGPAAQKAGLRLDSKDRAFAGGDTGPVIVAGKAGESLLYRYAAGLEPEHLMPPKKSKGPRPTASDIARLKQWIDDGARWPDNAKLIASAGDAPKHWAFQPPVSPQIPKVLDESWPRNPIDSFVLARLEKEGLRPSPEADKTTLIRRLSLDLIGLPPTIPEVDRFLADSRPDAYERLVDRLLASPHYGERWARRWLDKARYADTNGYEKDRERSMWPYRDWVVNNLNRDIPFDRFTLSQIAGDMLPNSTPDDMIATGFHRNTMRNEEGGIDVEEFRYAALVDRVSTTGQTWLGLTIQCAQCHTHKYDPITHKDYYRFLAYFNNADEPEEFAIPDPKISARRAGIDAEAAKLRAELETKFPESDPEAGWIIAKPIRASSEAGATLSIEKDGRIVASGVSPETDVYTITLERPETMQALRLDALADPTSPAFGPGRTPHGNFVLTGLEAAIVTEDQASNPITVRIAGASADVTQSTFDPAGVLDSNPRTGWAIDDGTGRLDKTRSITLAIEDWPKVETPAKLVIKLRQEYGGMHTLGRFRLRIKPKEVPALVAKAVEERRREHFAAKFAAWESSQAPHRWTVLSPTSASSRKLATMNLKPDGSVLVTGDKPNNDVYDLEVAAPPKSKITAIRLEALTDPSLPENGPGRAPLYALGGFILTEFVATMDGKPVKLINATQDFAEPGHTAAEAIDGVPESGWTTNGAAGRPHAAVFELAEPIEVGEEPRKIALTLHQFGIHNTTLGRFRVSISGDPGPVRDSGLPAEVEAAALVPASNRTAGQAEILKRQFLAVTPELAAERSKIDQLRQSAPKFSTTLVMQERDAKHARTTHLHKRGEFLSLAEKVTPGLLECLPAPSTSVRDRLDLARWLVSAENPLTARVAVNDMWLAFFGRGIVATPEDFGTRGERPSHPELLDFLAVEFRSRGWSVKAMHRLIVTGATYRQSSKATAAQMARDPKDILLARGGRFRVDAETVRDIALTASGLLNPKLGGPGVYPPQPDGVTSLAYGQAAWPTSSAPDRYRRGLYTFVKRAAPFAAFSLMDAPSPEIACIRRERSNTPLQALTLLNDSTFVEAAQALASRALAEAPANPDDRIRFLFRACLTRNPTGDELSALLAFHEKSLERFHADAAAANSAAGSMDSKIPRDEAAAWALVARAVLNLDETITRE